MHRSTFWAVQAELLPHLQTPETHWFDLVESHPLLPPDPQTQLAGDPALQ